MWSEDDPNKNNNAVAQDNNSEGMDDDNNNSTAAGETGQRNVTRERSLSVPCRSEAKDVETVVSKAKRASSYLWMLLHSQNCCVAADRCTHAGCADAKLVHLHLKTCPAGHDFPCPTRYPGCLQARKLLAHYRRCRNIRARQLGQSPSMKGQHVCLICSMVARQARSMLDSNAPSPKTSMQNGPVVAHKRSTNSSKCQLASSFTLKAKVNTGTLSSSTKPLKKTVLTSFTLSQDNRTAELFPRVKRLAGPVDEWDMPPPAPRKAHTSLSAPVSPLGGVSGGSSRPELTSDGAPGLGSKALLRKRSGSLGSDHFSRSQRAVTFAPRPEAPEPVSDPLVAVELAESNPAKDDDLLSPRRTRSASCHVLSVPNQPGTCGTIYEEIGHSASCMDE